MELEVVDLHSGTAWAGVAAAAAALGVDSATVREWIADPANPFIVRRRATTPITTSSPCFPLTAFKRT